MLGNHEFSSASKGAFCPPCSIFRYRLRKRSRLLSDRGKTASGHCPWCRFFHYAIEDRTAEPTPWFCFSNRDTQIRNRTIRAILDSPDMRLDGFVGPGHVSTVIGCRPYDWIAKDEGKPVVVSGFEPLDILQSIVMLLRQLRTGEAKVENQYKRVVPWEGNRAALRVMAEVFELRPYFEWRGLGFISQSALKIRTNYGTWDAEQRFTVPGVRATDPKAAQCGEVLKGVLKPAQCKLFGRECAPEQPVGALMVSSEGSCAAYYNYEHRKPVTIVNAAAQ
jgi:hydrogenase expression/formation protein HypD